MLITFFVLGTVERGMGERWSEVFTRNSTDDLRLYRQPPPTPSDSPDHESPQYAALSAN